MFSAIILSAGESRRFGSPKALARLDNGIPIIDYLIGNLLKVGGLEIIVVLGAHADCIKPLILKHNTPRIVHNKDHNFGQTSSVQKGVQNASQDTTGYLLLPVDCPFIKGNTIEQLMTKFEETSPSLLIPVFDGRKGHPPVFNKACREDILSLDTGTGMNVYQHLLEKETKIFETDDEGVLLTFNTLEEFDAVKKKL